MERCEILLHGRRLAYRRAGERGPTVLLIHGITQESSNWEGVAEALAPRARLIAIDLPGHGDSENPAGDHSIGAYASTVRDLLLALGETRATVVGHSLGGGVALQFAYLFPELIERLVLVDSGGLGPEVSPLLRAASLPGADPVIALLASEPVRDAAMRLSRRLRRMGLRFGTDIRQVWQGLQNLGDPDARRAFVWTVRAVIGATGQRVSANDRLYLAEHVPTLVVWGADDRIIPLKHGLEAHERIPGARLQVLPDVGHFPHLDDPERVARVIAEFLDDTEPADVPRERWAEIVRNGGAATRPRT